MTAGEKFWLTVWGAAFLAVCGWLAGVGSGVLPA
jgi:hypothetical protein